MATQAEIEAAAKALSEGGWDAPSTAAETALEAAERVRCQPNPELDRLRAENAELREILNECADDLQTELEHRYGYPAIHPAMLRKFYRDMAPVERARDILTRTTQRELE